MYSSYNMPYMQPTIFPNYTPQMQQVQQVQQPQPVPEKKTNCEWIHVNGIQQVKDHIVQPQQTLYFLDNNAPVFYVKAADNFGTCKIDAFKMQKIDVDTMNFSAPNINTTNISAEEIEHLKARIEMLEKNIMGGMPHESIATASEQSNA